MISTRSSVVRIGTFGPGLLGFGESVSRENIDVASAQFASEVAQLYAAIRR